jgi:hypothetical protein
VSDVGLNQVLARNSLANSKIALARSYVFRGASAIQVWLDSQGITEFKLPIASSVGDVDLFSSFPQGSTNAMTPVLGHLFSGLPPESYATTKSTILSIAKQAFAVLCKFATDQVCSFRLDT